MSVTLTTTQAKQIFEKIGAKIESGGRHLIACLFIDGKHIFRILISYGNKAIPTGTAHKIFKEAHLIERRHWIGLRECPLQKDDYIDILRQRSIL